jgi:hypothetical protein
MLFALLLLASTSVPDWVPMRWSSSEPKTLDLLRDTPVNCILLERPLWSPGIVKAAQGRGIAVLGVVRPGTPASSASDLAASLLMDGIVLEGDFEESPSASKLLTIRLPSRAKMRFDANPVVGTFQGVWPGIQAEEEGKTKAAPSGGPWINTNGGFLRFVRAAAPKATVWIANTPPAGNVITPERYMQAIADAAIIGARWVIALDDAFSKSLLAADERTVKDWKRIAAQLAWFEAHPEWRSMKPLSQLAIVQDTDSGALFSGGVLDMIAVKHTPVLAVPAHSLTPDAMADAKLAVNVAPATLSPEQKDALRGFARRGGTMLSGPETWKFPPVKPDSITLSEADVKTLDEIWKEMNSMTGRRNLGARLFNVSSMLSNLVESADGKTAVLHLVNYSGYPVENVTVHLLKKYKTARLIAPGAPDKTLEVYENEDGSGVDIDTVGVTGSLVLE